MKCGVACDGAEDEDENSENVLKWKIRVYWNQLKLSNFHFSAVPQDVNDELESRLEHFSNPV